MDPNSQTSSQRPSKRRRLVSMMPSLSSLSDLLTAFGAQKSPTSASRMQREAQNQRFQQQSPLPSPNTSDSATPSVRRNAHDGDHAPSIFDVYASAADAVNGQRSGDDGNDQGDTVGDDVDGADDDDDDDEIVVKHRPIVPTQPAKRTSTRAQRRRSEPQPSTRPRRQAASKPQVSSRTLPARSTRAAVDYRLAQPKSPRTPRSEPKPRTTRILVSDTVPNSPTSTMRKQAVVETARNRVRGDIAANTKPRRDAFLLANKEYFQPLLPTNNYVSKLERLSDKDEAEQEACVIAYKLEPQPSGVQATMKPYQLEGLAFLVSMYRNGMSAILGDEMGLGKTLQTLSLFQWLAENQPVTGEARPHLVICPLSVLSSWMAESRRWVPGLNVVRFHGPTTERDRLKQRCLELKQRHQAAQHRSNASDSDDESRIDVVVTTYDTFAAEHYWFKRAFVWKFCVLDEGHKIKNDKTNIAYALQTISAEYRLLLTGTPLQNNLHEMWALLHWLFPEVFTADTAEQFKQAFDLTVGTVSTDFMDHARRLLELIMLRRMKSSPGVNLGLPPKEEVLLYVPLTPMQRFWYTRLLTRADSGTLDDLFRGLGAKEQQALQQETDDRHTLARLEEASKALELTQTSNSDAWAESKAIMEAAIRKEEPTQKGGWQKLMNLLMQLRKVCIHPYILRDATPGEYDIGEHVKVASSKFIVLDKLIDELVIKKRKKVLIFSGFTSALDLVEELLLWKGDQENSNFRFARLDGSTARAQRNLSIRLFNNLDNDIRVMLLSTRAGGLGINLTSATEVVFLDEDWNPQVTLQAEARAHRIGQTKKVTVYKLYTQGTVEEQMMGRIRKKLYLSTKITESMRNIHTSSDGATSKKRKRESSYNNTIDPDDAPQLDTASLQMLIRRGAQTLARPEIDVHAMLGWDWEKTLEKCKDKPIDALIEQDTQGTEVDEQTWLNTMERVETAVFEGRSHQKSLGNDFRAAIPSNIARADRRVNKNTTVMMDGFAINKESLLCGDWEAVPTLAGKDPRLANPKREKRAPIQHQDHCQVCADGGELALCCACPRVYHAECLDADSQARMHSVTFYCPQHQCRDCSAKTADAGGLIFRCRWCEAGFCEDCLDWDAAQLVGDTLPEFELAGFGRNKQAYYIECPSCLLRCQEEPKVGAYIEAQKKRFAKRHRAFLAADAQPVESAIGSPYGSNSYSNSGSKPSARQTKKPKSKPKPLLDSSFSSAQRTPLTVSEAATPVFEERPLDSQLTRKKPSKIARAAANVAVVKQEEAVGGLAARVPNSYGRQDSWIL